MVLGWTSAGPADAAPLSPVAAPSRVPAATVAHARAIQLVVDREYDEAVAQLDLATELEPTWSDPVRLRAEVFAAARLLPHLAALHDVPDMCLVGEPTARRFVGDTVKIGRRGQLCGRVTARGVQGHSAYPERADNPLPRLVRFLHLLTDTPLDHGSARFGPSTISVTSVDTGNPTANVTPASASAMFDVRFNDLHTRVALESRIRRLADAQLGLDHTRAARRPRVLQNLVRAASH